MESQRKQKRITVELIERSGGYPLTDLNKEIVKGFQSMRPANSLHIRTAFLQRLTALCLSASITACGGGSSTEGATNSHTSTAQAVSEFTVSGSITAPTSKTMTFRHSIPIEISVNSPAMDELDISWEVTSGPQGGDMTVDVPEFGILASVSATVMGNYVVTVTASDSASNSTADIAVNVVSPIPDLPDVLVSSEGFRPDDGQAGRLFANHANVRSLDSYPLAVSYIWRKNGVVYDTTQSSILNNYGFSQGDSFTVALKVIAGSDEIVGEQSPQYIIPNSLSSPYAQIEPITPNTDNDLTVNVLGVSDRDQDLIDLRFEWFINDTLVANETDKLLPSSYLDKDVSVHARIYANDGNDTTIWDTEPVTISAGPNKLVTSGVPSVLNFGEEISFKAEFVSYDGTPVKTNLVAAPLGLSYDANGTVSWKPEPVMFAATETYYAYFDAVDTGVSSIELTVNNTEHKPVLARSDIEIPRHENNLFVGEFDQSNGPDIFTTDSLNRVFTLGIKNGELVQDWLYPYALSTNKIVQIAPLPDTDRGFIAVTDSAVVSVSSAISSPKTLYESDIEIIGAVYDDLDQNGADELTLLLENDTIVFLDADNFSKIETLTLIGANDDGYSRRESYSIVAGNIDDDSALELITGGGEVIDGGTRQVEWQHANAFNNVIAVGDIDGDGKNEFVGTGSHKELISFDARLESDIHKFGVADICSVHIANVDEDAQQEIITGDCQHGEVNIYDASTGTLELQHQYDTSISSTARSIRVSDVDDDGIVELIWGGKANFSEANGMHVASIPGLGDTSTPEIIFISDPAQLGPLSLVGRTEITPGNAENVFLVIETDRGFSGARILTINDNGVVRLSDEISNNQHNNVSGFLIDSDLDGTMEIVVAAGDLLDGKLQHRRLDDFSLLQTSVDLTHTSGDNVTARKIIPTSLANGSPGVLMATTDLKMRLHDLALQTTSWISPRMAGKITGLLEHEEAGVKSFIAASESQIVKWVPRDDIFVQEVTTDFGCHFIEKLTIDNQDRFACIKTDYRERILTILDQALAPLSTIQLTFEVSAMSVLSGNHSDQLLVGSKGWTSNSSVVEHSELMLIDPYRGLVLWRTKKPIGNITDIKTEAVGVGEHTRLIMVTQSAVYVTQH